MKKEYQSPKAEWISFRVGEELMDVELGSSPNGSPGAGTQTDIMGTKSSFQFGE